MVYVRRGKTTSNHIRSCDTVSAGAFFSQAQLHVPQKKMRQHTREPMVVPARMFPSFIVVHPQLRFAFFAALFDGPAHATSPHKGPQGRAHRSMTDRVGIGRLSPCGPLDHEPDGSRGKACLRERDTLAGTLILDRTLGPFRAFPPIPTGGGQAGCQGRHRAWRLV